ncbi:hypothetical protein SODALDRAFT_96197 [Sodiomyces alkalinus F11]|uniref:Cytidyltransferase-like domain-containing protein n=1 Tax=Sodiomyces alkalinus (strain CBS 110278 / VKM F-3762 / F11) TaxID=1314773 RepID=A0A3N2Q0Z0_SODAK|nr:hypothetical protein SODALDRAFT_96197 [Sodiomyces alkalinus F11]ROT40427.1 hypothetical protein SODALDRAFT_96197 [Sodiomyces alkalinus F11]
MARNPAFHRPLEIYFQRFYDPDQTSKSPIFKTGKRDALLLRRQFPNTILVMPGSYNPPHHGHLELLKHGLAQGGGDLNILAAIVIPTDDSRLSSKFAGRHRPLVLPKHLRAQLWREAEGLPPHVFVFEKPNSEWGVFREQVERATRADGFRVEFMALVGPDYVSLRGFHDPSKWGCRNTMVTDACRPVDFVAGGMYGTGSPMRLSACDEWRHVNFKPAVVQRLLRAKEQQHHASGNDLHVAGNIAGISIAKEFANLECL